METGDLGNRSPMRPTGSDDAGERQGERLSDRQRDFLLLNIFVLAQHGYVEKAGVLAEALHALGDGSVHVQIARAVLRFLAGDWASALAVLEDIDRIAPIERFGDYQMTDAQRMRRYLKARCLKELGDDAGAKEVVDSYLRHGEAGAEGD